MRDHTALHHAVTDAEELALINTALTSLLEGGQAVSVLGRSWSIADYDKLTKRRDELTARIARTTRGGIKLQRAVGHG